MTSKPKHKPLEWRIDDDNYYVADTIDGELCLCIDEDYGWLVVKDGWDDSWVKYPEEECGFPTLQAAKDFVATYIDELLAKYVTVE